MPASCVLILAYCYQNHEAFRILGITGEAQEGGYFQLQSPDGRKGPYSPEGSGTGKQLEQRDTEFPRTGLAEEQTHAGFQSHDRYFFLLNCAEPVCPEASGTGEPDALGPKGYYFWF